MKVNLGPIEEIDTRLMFTWHNDSAVTEYLARKSMSRADVNDWFTNLSERRRAYSIKVDDFVIGYAPIDIDSTNQKCEVGIIIGEKDYWGKGIGKKVAQQVTAIAFDSLSLHRVLAVMSELNTASIKCFLRTGFSEEGWLRDGYYRDGEFHDLILLSILESEWRNLTIRASEWNKI
jgi:RimJ/RimL family protein N-acetyltransferase